MNRIIISTFLLTSIIGCDKDHHQAPAEQPTVMQLLTDGPWLLKAHGFDDDNSGHIEDYENMADECHRDNTTLYRTNGTGTVSENELICGNDPLSSFEWKFIDNNKAIEVSGQRMDIHTLTKNDLHLIAPIPYLVTPLHIIYKKVP